MEFGRTSLVFFTRHGEETAKKICDYLAGLTSGLVFVHGWYSKKDHVPVYDWQKIEGSLKEWTGARFADSDTLIFVGATGIAVRSIAPYLKSKKTDPAVLCVDELGRFVISLVSGHIGGANELTAVLAEGIGALPVVTTATDLNGKFAVDVFARKNDLQISDMKLAKEISAKILDGKTIRIMSEFPWEGEVPPELCMTQMDPDIYIGIHEVPGILNLIPKAVVLGIGCRKNKEPEKLELFVNNRLQAGKIHPQAVTKICSVDIKKDETAICSYADRHGIAFVTYEAQALAELDGPFTPSAFVQSKIGVDNVCERSAVLGSDGGRLLIRKTASDGMTLAAALMDRRITFE